MSSSSPATPAPAAKSAGARAKSLTERIRAVRDALVKDLVERDDAIQLALIAALAGEHLLLLGPPGTAKSLVARRLRLAFASPAYFERLLTRFTVPEELFGPLSIKGLEDDRYERLTASYLPTASIAFLDEIFKANSAILNALLTLLNERLFDNGTQRVETPLIAVIGASNELPEGEELDALFDRFLLRLHVGPVSRKAFIDLLALRGHPSVSIPPGMALTDADLKLVERDAETVTVPDDVVVLLCDLRDWLAAEQIPVSDRRWRKIVKLLQVSALTNGRNRVEIWDCWLLQHCLWDVPENRQKIYDWYAERVGASAAMDPARLTKIVVSWEAQLKQDQESRSQTRDEQGRLLFRGTNGKSTPQQKGAARAKRGTEALFLAPPNAHDSDGRRVGERTHGGRGYTQAELNHFQVVDQNYYGHQRAFQHWSQRAEYIADENNWLMEDVDLPPITEPTRHKAVYVASCVADIDAVRNDVTSYIEGLVNHMSTMEATIRDHLWVPSSFVAPASQRLTATKTEVETLQARINAVRSGYERLPKEVPAAKEVPAEPAVKKGRK